MRVTAVAMSGGTRFRWAGRALALASGVLRGHRFRRLPWPASLWTVSRDTPALPGRTFRDSWTQRTRREWRGRRGHAVERTDPGRPASGDGDAS